MDRFHPSSQWKGVSSQASSPNVPKSLRAIAGALGGIACVQPGQWASRATALGGEVGIRASVELAR